MNYLEKTRNWREYLEDMTYQKFEEFIQKDILRHIKNAYNGKQNIVNFCLKFVDSKMLGYGTHDSCINYGFIDSEMFISLLKNIPGFKGVEAKDKEYTFCYDLVSLIEYYYEELQRIEYQTGKAR